MRDAPDYFGDDVYVAFGRAMAQAQHFESAMGLYAFSHRATDYAPFKDDPGGWREAFDRGERDELGDYGVRLLRMTAGPLAEELDVPELVADDLAAIVVRRNDLAHRWYVSYFARRDDDGAAETAIVELRELEDALRVRADMLTFLRVAAVLSDRTLSPREVEVFWRRDVLRA